jgi:hypothetical protein
MTRNHINTLMNDAKNRLRAIIPIFGTLIHVF